MKNRIIYFDGIRGIAAIIIYLYHFSLVFIPNQYRLNTVLTVLSDLSISIFFILSGFALSFNTMKTGDKMNLFISSAGRYFRLVIPIVTSLIIVYGLMKLNWMANIQLGRLTGSVWIQNFWTFQPNFRSVLFQGGFGTLFLKNANSYNPILWTMMFEWVGSFRVYFFLSLLAFSKWRWLVYPILIFFTWEKYFLHFILGVLLADLMAHGHLKWLANNTLSKLIMLGLSLLLIGWPSPKQYSWQCLSFLASTADYGLSVFVLLALTGFSNLTVVFLTAKPVQFLGKISFSVYLMHMIVLGSFSAGLFIFLEPFIPYQLNIWVIFMLTTALLMMSAYFFHVWIDSFSAAMPNKLIKRWLEKS
jgi:peptidoglycan/LPS O-acetylase OafA/YrhL